METTIFSHLIVEMPIFCIYRTVGYQKEFEKRVAWEHDQFLGGDFKNEGEWLFLGGRLTIYMSRHNKKLLGI